MKNHFDNSVLHDGVVFGFDNAILEAVDASNGALLWSRRGFGKGSLILAAGHLIVLGEDGDVALVEARRDRYVEKARQEALSGRCRTPPALADGRLYLRSRSEIACLE